MARDLVDAAQGLLLGTMVGDAMGMAVEGWSRRRIAASFGLLRGYVDGRLPAGTYTDETEMALAAAEALVESRGFDPEVLAKTLAERFTLWRGYHTSACTVVSRLRSGKLWKTVGMEEAWTSGPAARVGPVALYLCESPRLPDAARDCADITDRHVNAEASALVQAEAVAEVVRSGVLGMKIVRDALLARLVELAREFGEALSGRLERLSEISVQGSLEARADLLARIFVRDETVLSTLPTALGAFLSASDFEEAVLTAVNAGGSADAAGALAGALAGAYHGAAAIPEDLLEGLSAEDDGRTLGEILGERLGRVAGEGSAGRLERDPDDDDEAAADF